jgi:sec-independent protein translocase protein TatB
LKRDHRPELYSTAASGANAGSGAIARDSRASFNGVFGFSFGELVVLIVVAIVVIGPKDLPRVLRKLGQWAGKMRRMASELRAQSGIDDVLRAEGLSEDIAEIRKLARGELDQITRAARIDTSRATELANDPYLNADVIAIDREREFPRDGADAYRALPDTAIVYAETLPASPHARDPLYTMGDATAVLPDATADATATADSPSPAVDAPRADSPDPSHP